MTVFEIIYGVLANFGLLMLLFLYIQLTTSQILALKPHRLLLIGLAALWISMVPIKLMIVDHIIPPADAIEHELFARDIAANLQAGDFEDALADFHLGNSSFRFFLGVFYALTGAPISVTYGINAALSMWALTSLLALLCQTTRATSVPTWLVIVTCANPTALVWTTGVLKEGPILWGIVMILRFTLVFTNSGRGVNLLTTGVGFVVTVVLRPHIAAAWIIAVCAGGSLRIRNIWVFGLGALGLVASVQILNLLLPDMLASFSETGVVETMNERYLALEGTGGSAIQFINGTPIPLVDGGLLLLCRPFPTEVSDVASLMAGMEIWILSAMALWNWFRLPQRKQALNTPLILAVLVAFLLLAFYFSYMYNMGLMVRQRLQAFPAILCLVGFPALLLTSQGSNAQVAKIPSLKYPKMQTKGLARW